MKMTRHANAPIKLRGVPDIAAVAIRLGAAAVVTVGLAAIFWTDLREDAGRRHSVRIPLQSLNAL